MSNNWLDVRTQARIDNKHNPQSVIAWTLVGSSYKRGRRIPGFVRLNLSGGGWIWFEESTPLVEALAEADARGFDTKDVRQRLAVWIETGVGATFSLQ